MPEDRKFLRLVPPRTELAIGSAAVRVAGTSPDPPGSRGLRLALALEIEGHRGRQHFDMADFLGGRIEQEVAIPGISARAHGLEEILHAHTDFALDPADGLLQGASEERIGRIHDHRILQFAV